MEGIVVLVCSMYLSLCVCVSCVCLGLVSCVCVCVVCARRVRVCDNGVRRASIDYASRVCLVYIVSASCFVSVCCMCLSGIRWIKCHVSWMCLSVCV